MATFHSEKDTAALEASARGPLSSDDGGDDGMPPQLSTTTERKLTTKIDLRVISFLCILYLLAFLDRVNIANAAVFGLAQDLKLNPPSQFNTALTVFFIPYILFEIPSNLLLRRFRPRLWLSGCMFLFGLVSAMQGLVQNFGGLIVTRLLLGLFETGIFPGCFYVIGMWYTRAEAQRRYSFFFGSTSLAGAFGGLLASAIGKMDGKRGYHGWRWIFILEGVLTCVVALTFFFLIPEFPDKARWLSAEERAFLDAKHRREQGDWAVRRRITVRDVVRIFADVKIFLGGLMYLGLIVPAYGYAFFSPTIIRSYGYSSIQTQLHSVPPFVCSFVVAMVVAYASDKTRHRFLFALASIGVTIAGFALLLGLDRHLPAHPAKGRPAPKPQHIHAKYGALFLIAMGTFSAMPIVVCWFNMNLGGHHRRAVGVAWQIGFGNLGGIVATYAFLAQDAPLYRKGYSICLGFTCLSAVSCMAYWLACWSQNRRRDRDARIPTAGTPAAVSDYEKSELGDLSPAYRYLL
ncbi:MAG: hypothetical protein M1826_004431 [Phylliscum demangeonii]|nr:MAG: hypothetical protein M1826_004431 [Phylliscum demangeonii]